MYPKNNVRFSKMCVRYLNLVTDFNFFFLSETKIATKACFLTTTQKKSRVKN